MPFSRQERQQSEGHKFLRWNICSFMGWNRINNKRRIQWREKKKKAENKVSGMPQGVIRVCLNIIQKKKAKRSLNERIKLEVNYIQKDN